MPGHLPPLPPAHLLWEGDTATPAPPLPAALQAMSPKLHISAASQWDAQSTLGYGSGLGLPPTVAVCAVVLQVPVSRCGGSAGPAARDTCPDFPGEKER